MIVGVTGHRPSRIGGYDAENPVRRWIRRRFREEMEKAGATKGVSGMAQGADQDMCRVCIEIGIPFTAVVPFSDFDAKWPIESRDAYRVLLEQAAAVVLVSPPGYQAWKFAKRDQWVVDHCELLLAAWDGEPSGTGNTVQMAEKVGRAWIRIDPGEAQR